MCPKDGYVIFRDSQLICGTLDKATLGGGSKDNLFHVLMRDYSPSVAADRMSRLARLCARWIGDHGFSIGISDVTPSEALKSEKHQLLAKGYAKCDRLIAELKDGTLRPQAGCDLEQTLEVRRTTL
jgi:DNA-directed RNA polymerase III subunit RPC1